MREWEGVGLEGDQAVMNMTKEVEASMLDLLFERLHTFPVWRHVLSMDTRKHAACLSMHALLL